MTSGGAVISTSGASIQPGGGGGMLRVLTSQQGVGTGGGGGGGIIRVMTQQGLSSGLTSVGGPRFAKIIQQPSKLIPAPVGGGPGGVILGGVRTKVIAVRGPGVGGDSRRTVQVGGFIINCAVYRWVCILLTVQVGGFIINRTVYRWVCILLTVQVGVYIIDCTGGWVYY